MDRTAKIKLIKKRSGKFRTNIGYIYWKLAPDTGKILFLLDRWGTKKGWFPIGWKYNHTIEGDFTKAGILTIYHEIGAYIRKKQREEMEKGQHVESPMNTEDLRSKLEAKSWVDDIKETFKKVLDRIDEIQTSGVTVALTSVGTTEEWQKAVSYLPMEIWVEVEMSDINEQQLQFIIEQEECLERAGITFCKIPLESYARFWRIDWTLEGPRTGQ